MPLVWHRKTKSTEIQKRLKMRKNGVVVNWVNIYIFKYLAIRRARKV
jgi:hypothetical protein